MKHCVHIIYVSLCLLGGRSCGNGGGVRRSGQDRGAAEPRERRDLQARLRDYRALLCRGKITSFQRQISL